MTNFNRINTKTLFIQSINILILVFLAVFSVYKVNQPIFVERWAEILTILSISLLIYQIIIFLNLKISIMDFRFLFMIFTHIFLFGQIWLIGFDKSELIFWGLIFRYPENLLYEAGLYSVCYTQAIFIGLLFALKSKKNTKSFTSKIDSEMLRLLLYRVGILLLIISFPFRIYIDLLNIITNQSIGIYSGRIMPFGPAKDIAILMIPGIIYIVCSKKKSRSVNSWIIGSTVFYNIMVMLLTGDRRYYFTAIVALLICYSYSYDPKIKLRTIIKLGIVSVLTLNVVTVIRDLRKSSLPNLGFFREHGMDIFSFDFLTETLAEFGGTFISVIIAVKLIPEHVSYQYGLSYYGAIPSLFPIGWLFPDFFKKVSIAGVLNSIAGLPVGSSLPAEMYSNFGWFGVIGAFCVGIFLSKIFHPMNNHKTNKYLIANHYSLFYILINYVRASTLEMLRQSVIVYFVPMIILYLYYKKIKTKKFV